MNLRRLKAVARKEFIHVLRDPPIQAVTHIITTRYFVFIPRGIYLKDVGIGVLWPVALFLAAFGVIVMTVAVRKFKKKII
jgi:ABC-2 type transport system permease protein